MSSRFSAVPFLVLVGLFLAGCSTTTPPWIRPPTPLVQAASELKTGRKKTLSAEERAAAYLTAADLSSRQFGQNAVEPRARIIYNVAAAELTDLLRTADAGQLWNRPLTAPGYQLRFQPATRDGVWSPGYFTDFKLASKIRHRAARRSITEGGVGGTLVGIRKTPAGKPALFEPRVGFTAPVTATLDFRGRDATLTLSDPAERRTVSIRGKTEPLAADFTAPLGVFPPLNELWEGLMGLIQVEKYLGSSGLYMLHPYDPDRIPVILVHGLVSTTHMWVNVINEVEADPELRGHFQFWAFGYPTGNPVAYSALRCREELAKLATLKPAPPEMIMVGHSMGGLVSRMQAIDTGRVIWDENFHEKADQLYAKLPPNHLVKRALIFGANPRVKRIVFICTPHRGSQMALSSIGAIGTRLIRLPGDLVNTLTDSLGDVIETVSGRPSLPNSITSLSPKNATLLAMNKLPIRAPHHSIIGDRGRGDSPNSSDGVVPYWSSHLDSAESELIVPGPHGSYQLPQTIDELKRILRLHLRKSGRRDR